MVLGPRRALVQRWLLGRQPRLEPSLMWRSVRLHRVASAVQHLVEVAGVGRRRDGLAAEDRSRAGVEKLRPSPHLAFVD